MTQRVTIRSIGHPEHYSVAVSGPSETVAVIDTGGDFRVTRWCPINRDWCGDEIGAPFNTQQPAINAARAYVARRR